MSMANDDNKTVSYPMGFHSAPTRLTNSPRQTRSRDRQTSPNFGQTSDVKATLIS